MKRILFLLLSSFFLFALSAQGGDYSAAALKSYREGVNMMGIGEYGKALKSLKAAIAKERKMVEAYWRLAEVYQYQRNESLRLGTLQRACHATFPYFDKTSLMLGKAYFENGMYDESLQTLEKMTSNNTLFSSEREEWILRNKKAIELRDNPIPFTPENMGDNINTEYDDYWPSLTADGLTFSTTVGISQNAFVQEDIFHSSKDSINWTKSEALPLPMNTGGNEGAQSFSFDGRYMFFVACDRREGLGGCDIYYSMHNGEEWNVPVNPGAPLNSRYKDTTPTLSAAGDRLYFSSERPGGKGKGDIWYAPVDIASDGYLSFGTPVNLGDSINTAEEEISPFIHADGKTLYFASAGHWGLGGSDVFKATLSRDRAGRDATGRDAARHVSTGEMWTTPINLGYPLNTHLDELGFVVIPSGKKAYFSSDSRISRFAKNAAPTRGKDIFVVDLYEKIRPEPVVVISGKITDANSDVPLQARVEMYRVEDDKKVFDSFSDEETGEYSAALPADDQYGFMVSKKGFMFHSDNFVPPSRDEAHFDFAQQPRHVSTAIRKDIALQPIEVGGTLILRNVFFDVDSYELKPESRAELDRLVDFLKQNRTLSVELGGHTDITGSYEHNVTLSKNRALAVVNYLSEKRIAPTRLTHAGYASDVPIAGNDSDEGRALNRRTEVKVVKK
jgi:outer membrane protein OmpA-like peptidoglycan-associated protein